jgi:formamidopyrimidine-DNA glycosylase
MPELPDITVYIEALEPRVVGHTLARIQLNSPFLLRTATPPVNSIEGHQVVGLRRLGKRICFGFEDELWLVLHLMITGRLHWKMPGRVATKAALAKFPKNQLATFQFDNGLLSLTEAGTQRRASLHLVKGEPALRSLDRGGIELFQKTDSGVPGRTARLGWGGKGGVNSGLGKFLDLKSFATVLRSENHTLKRALTDPRLFSGIGNAYSDEILWNAHLSPVKLTQKMTDEELLRLYEATRNTLVDWVERLRAKANGDFPEKVTAFRNGMATHGRYHEPCPRCGAKIQRIRYATNETNYCPNCQTGGKLLADRALSRLLREDWPQRADELA